MKPRNPYGPRDPQDYDPAAPQATDQQKRQMGRDPKEDVTPAAWRQWKSSR